MQIIAAITEPVRFYVEAGSIIKKRKEDLRIINLPSFHTRH